MIRNSVKVIVILGAAFLLRAAEKLLDGYVAMSGLLAVIGMACVLGMKCHDGVTDRLSQKFGKLWIAAAGVLLCLIKTPLSFKERLFCVIAYMPMGWI